MSQKYHLLVVDDQEPIRELVREMYGEKFFVTTADRLESAVEILNNVTIPDLVLTDLDMRQPLDGIRLLQGINVMREESRYRNLETAVMSGRD
ncbi:MAG TPA: response regulator, partial [Candidatus Nanoarchaeia archaeon]|nr:response regulator [Candidatus Nanoarchaeia archaeon]